MTNGFSLRSDGVEGSRPVEPSSNDDAAEIGYGAYPGRALLARDVVEGEQEGERTLAPSVSDAAGHEGGRHIRHNISKSSRANIVIASLNMKGKGNSIPLHEKNKWNAINHLLKHRKIGVLALQETHLTGEDVERLNIQYSKRMKIFYSSMADHPNRGGVAIVLNKELVRTKEASCLCIVEGRAILVSTSWHGDSMLSVLAIYAPNDRAENANFWNEVSNKWDECPRPRLNAMMGDFNIVENAIDRAPCHSDSDTAVSALVSLKNKLSLVDAWRIINPLDSMFTFRQPGGGSRSRIDRIYIPASSLQTTDGWVTTSPGFPTDHDLIMARLSDPDSPFIGRGRWTMPLMLLKDKKFISEIQREGRKMLTEMRQCRHTRTEQKNPQRIFLTFKNWTKTLAMKVSKTSIPKMDASIKKLEQQIKDRVNLENNATNGAEEGLLKERLDKLTTLRTMNARAATAARWRLDGESISRYWSSIAHQKTPRDTIYKLQEPGSDPAVYRTSSRGMAELAKTYHDKLQREGLPPLAERGVATKRALSDTSATLSCRDSDGLAGRTTRRDIINALRLTKNGSSAGLDGLPYELWKKLLNKFEEQTKSSVPTFDIVEALNLLFNDIEESGVDPSTDFTKGWMCPIFKKKDVSQIENYRPITLLNTDYKIMTKVMATKLSKAAQKLIHKDQAGFLPGRKIFDQIRLAQLMIKYAEEQEVDGMIITLDQEKVYDKIDHQYLWAVLKKFNIPDAFIKTVKALYTNAETVVVINGELSSPFRVTRGVRQGDPLSCLLFILAIEPLACMLRESNLAGITLPGAEDRIIATLFADDTTAYLSCNDSFDDLQSILQRWCSASGAKFNVAKTEVVPIGSKVYRDQVIDSRQTSVMHPPIPGDIHIAKEGEAIRSLGAFIGNGITQAYPWGLVEDRIRESLERWGRACTSMKGRRLVSQMIVGGMTQFLAVAQGMPKPVEKSISKIMRNFIWQGTAAHPPIRFETLCQPIGAGGIKLLDLSIRNSAINLTWLKSYLQDKQSRPTWALLADALITNAITHALGNVEQSAVVNPFLQSWKVSANKLTPGLKDMLRAGEKFNVRFDAIKMSDKMKESMPIWYHIGVKSDLRKMNNSPISKCLRDRHLATTVNDILIISQRTRTPGLPHRARRNCACRECKVDRQEKGCENPHKCSLAAGKLLNALEQKWAISEEPQIDGLSLTPRRKSHNIIARATNGEMTFDPSVTAHGTPYDGIRVFVDDTALTCQPALRLGRGASIEEEAITAFTDGSCLKNGCLDAAAGSGVYFGDHHPGNSAIKIPNTLPQSNQVGEVVAILIAAQKTPPFVPLHIVSDSKYAIDGLTVNLLKWERRGWIGVKNRLFFKAAAACLRKRTARTTFKWVKGHLSSVGNVKADELAKLAAMKLVEDELNLLIDSDFNLSGACLKDLTQALAYLGISELRLVLPREAAVELLQLARNAIREACGTCPTDASIWRSLHHKDISKNIGDFLWKMTHRAFKIGRFWENVPGYEERAICTMCGIVEDIDHILLRCAAPGQQSIWKAAKKLWEGKRVAWPSVSIGSIIGCSLFRFKTERLLPLPGADRLFRILISESTHMIWKLRCERVISHGEEPGFAHSENEVLRRWEQALDKRLQMDKYVVRMGRRRTGITPNLVARTWSGTLEDEANLPEKWVTDHGVFAGSRPPERIKQLAR